MQFQPEKKKDTNQGGIAPKRSKRRLRVSIIGVGNVGGAVATALSSQAFVVCEIILWDRNKNRATGLAMDLEDTQYWRLDCPASTGSRAFHTIRAAERLVETGASDLVIYACGVKQRPGEARTALGDRNESCAKQIIPVVARHSPNARFIVVTNPCERMSAVVHRLIGSSRDASRVISTGTMLDSARLHREICTRLETTTHSPQPANVHALAVGEHGPAVQPMWDRVVLTRGNVLKVVQFDANSRDCITEAVKRRAGRIIDMLGFTCYGVASAVVALVVALYDQEKSGHSTIPLCIGSFDSDASPQLRWSSDIVTIANGMITRATPRSRSKI